MVDWIKYYKNKELFIALYFLLFILGGSVQISSNFYNEARILEILILLGLGFYSFINKKSVFFKKELIFLLFTLFGFCFWVSYQIIIDILLLYLLYKAFFILKYNEFLSKFIIFFSFLVFIMLPVSLWNYLNGGAYQNWYPLPWNIRIYNSYFLIFLIFTIWFYIKDVKYHNIYLAFIFLAFFSILLDGGRSVTLAYTVFIGLICVFNHKARFKLLLVYGITWFAYFFIIYFSSHMNSGLRLITRESTSGRYDLWVNAFRCWVKSPILGCGFYQLDEYPNLSAHPHNLFIQILTETGVVGLSFLIFVVWSILKKIKWNLKENYFVIAALIAIAIDLSLSGIHIYPITQVSLLWLFVFLLKNPEFQHAKYFNQINSENLHLTQTLYFITWLIITFIFFYLFLNTSALSESLPSTPPRFWEYGYQLF